MREQAQKKVIHTGNLRNIHMENVTTIIMQAPDGMFKRVVCMTLKPKSLMIKEYWIPIPPTKLARTA
jgi:hypothetical protein